MSTWAVCNSPSFAQKPLAVFPIRAERFAEHPSGDYVYASEIATDTVYRINLRTLELDTSFYGGNGPSGMAFSEDGSRLYVANMFEPAISVIDAATNALVSRIDLPAGAYDLEMGYGGYLYATPWHEYTNIMQINATTGEYVGQFAHGGVHVGDKGLLETSPDTKTLFFANRGSSPGTLAAYDVSRPTYRLAWTNIRSIPLGLNGLDLGDNGGDLAVSHDGTRVAYLTGTGNGIDGARDDIALLDTSDFSVTADYVVGDWPTEAVFSPDDAVLYAMHAKDHIDVIVIDDEKSAAAPLTQRYRQIATPSSVIVSTGARELYVDPTGQRLFAAIDSEVRVFDTGRRVIPEPSSWCLLGLGAFAMQSGFLGIRVSRRRRARSRAHLRHNGC